ncbi:hypothetical protein G6F31_017532 [Rhizopus arrhizus]|nr:hypothetical protein G6F31_017532 [Rhizopus arrhizus]
MIGSRISSTWFTGGSLAGLSMLMIEPSVFSTSYTTVGAHAEEAAAETEAHRLGAFRLETQRGIVQAQLVQTQRLGIDLFQIDGDRFVVVGADLDRQRVVLGQNLDAVELGLFRHAGDFTQAQADYSLDRIQVGLRVRAVGGLNRQLTDTLQVVVDFVQRAFGRLSDRDTVVGVTGSLPA